MPIVAYNVPGRTGTNLTPEAMRRIWEVDQVVAVKESSGDLRQIARICQEAPAGRVVLAGDDDLALASVAVDLKVNQVVDAPNWTVSAYVADSLFP